MTIRNKPSRHIVVVGAGILGACIAWRISERGFPVTLIDKSDPGSGASSHSFAMINADAKFPLHYHNLNRRSQDMWTRFAAELARDGDGTSLGLRWGGKVTWVSDVDAAAQLEVHVRQMQSWGYPMRLLSESELSDMEPGLKVGSMTAAAYSENEGQVEPQLVIEACLDRLAERNCDVCRNTEVTGYAQTGEGRVKAVKTTSGDIRCDVVVLAAGSDTTRLASRLGVHVPQETSSGVVIRTTPLPPLLQRAAVIYAPPVATGEPEVHFRQCADGGFMVGEGDQETHAEDGSQAHANELLARASSYLPELAQARAVAVPAGLRPLPADGFPAIGFTTEVPNVYVVLTHSGVTLAPVLSQLVVQEICDGVLADAVLGSYRPQRFTSRTARDSVPL